MQTYDFLEGLVIGIAIAYLYALITNELIKNKIKLKKVNKQRKIKEK